MRVTRSNSTDLEFSHDFSIQLYICILNLVLSSVYSYFTEYTKMLHVCVYTLNGHKVKSLDRSIEVRVAGAAENLQYGSEFENIGIH